MPKAFTDRENELIGKRLLEQGDRQFSTFGLRKANVEEIARAAGISKGAFYNFYESKEALFMDVVEEVEQRVRREVLAAVDQPGPSPRARLFAVLKKAFSLFQSNPILRFMTSGDYDLLVRRLPAEKLQEHMAGDRAFFDVLIPRCREVGIQITAPPEQIIGLSYPLVLAALHEDDLSRQFAGNIDLLLELVAAYSLGEVVSEVHASPDPTPNAEEESRT